jgi:phosphoglycolate phosphatase
MPSYPDELARSARIICRYGMYGNEFDVTHSNKTQFISHVLSSGFLAAASTIMIGDRTHEVVGALANGVRLIGALWRYGSREELLSAGAAYLWGTPCKYQQCCHVTA